MIVMGFIFNIHWKLRKGLDPKWINKVTDIGLDDLPSEISFEEVKQMAIDEFKTERRHNGTTDKEYVITDICSE